MAYNNNNYGNRNYNNNNGGKYNGGGGKKNSQPAQFFTNSIFLGNPEQGKFLQIKFWSKTMGIDIGTCQPNVPITSEVIANSMKFGHVFAFQTLCELVDICEDVLESIKTTGTFETTALLAGLKKDAVIEISNGDNLNLPKGIYLVLYKNVDAGRRTPNFNYYPFASTVVMKGYNCNTGEATEKVKPTGDFKKFMTCIRESMKAFTLAQAHAINELSHNEKVRTRTLLYQIGQKMGLDTSSFNDGGVYQKQSNNNNGGNRGGYQQPYNNGYQRKSQPGQYNPGGPYGGNGGTYPARQPSYPEEVNAVVTNEPTEVTMDASVLRQANSLSDLG